MSFYECFLEDVTLHVEADVTAPEEEYFDYRLGVGGPGHGASADITSAKTEHGDEILSVLSVEQVERLKEQVLETASIEAQLAHQERLADRYDNRRHAA